MTNGHNAQTGFPPEEPGRPTFRASNRAGRFLARASPTTVSGLQMGSRGQPRVGGSSFAAMQAIPAVQGLNPPRAIIHPIALCSGVWRPETKTAAT